jgi:hypothetical protein
MTVNPAKVKFATSHLSFLGHIVSNNGVMIDPDRTRNITNFPPPRDVKGIARFMGMVNFLLNSFRTSPSELALLTLFARRTLNSSGGLNSNKPLTT